MKTFRQFLEDIRLYRGGKLPKDMVVSQNPIARLYLSQNPGVMDIGGRWFTNEIEDAKWYSRENDSPIFYIDIPEKDIKKYNVRNFPQAAQYSRKPDVEFILPKELANQAKML